MNRVESAISLNTAHAISRQRHTGVAPSPLATNRQRVAETLGRTGFVHVVGQLQDNFDTYLNRRSFRVEVSDLKPGMLRQITDWVSSRLSANRDLAEQAQANVRPERAIKLLT